MAVAGHTMHWDGPFNGVYVENCECGWGAFTFANTPETGIGKAHDKHLADPGRDIPTPYMRTTRLADGTLVPVMRPSGGR